MTPAAVMHAVGNNLAILTQLHLDVSFLSESGGLLQDSTPTT